MTNGHIEFDEIITQVLTDNTAQSVLNHLKALESNRAHVLTRWVWELLQNARDAASESDTQLAASIEQTGEEIVFRHNGDNFKREEIIHLIYHGSTKVDSEVTIGQYGSGFLTTHLLSPEIEVSGQLEDGRCFKFPLKREIDSVSELSESMKRASNDFVSSLSRVQTSDDFTTMFRYPLRDDAFEVVKEGIATLKQCAPFVVAFNREFSRIAIETPDGTMDFKVIERAPLEQGELEQVTVEVTENGNRKRLNYVLAHGDKSSVAIPLESIDGGQVCLSLGNTPRLFLGFPLVGTENFSFPVVINSLNFTPTENRDGIFLWQAPDVANQENQAAIEEACELLVGMLKFAASSSWHNAYRLAEIPDLQAQIWLNIDQLRKCIKELVIERIRQTPVVLNESGEAIPPRKAELPLADTPEGVVHLWDLLVGRQEDSDIWPRRDEAVGWCDAIKSWARVSERDVSSFEEMIDGSKLASIVHDISHDKSADPRIHRLSLLESSLKGDVSPIEWLDRLIGFLNTNGLAEVTREYRIVPSQRGFLRTLPNLRRDDGIDEELKDIAESLDWQIRDEIRDTRLASLSDETDSEGWDNEHVVGELIKRLGECAEKNPDGGFRNAALNLFSWIVNQEKWELLRSFPVFVGTSDSGNTTVVYLPRNAQDRDLLLSPVRTWAEDLQPFADLFPPARILSDEFFEVIPDTGTWQSLADLSIVRMDILIQDSVSFNKFYPDHPLREGAEHSTVEPVSITDVWRRADIMERVRDSQARARLFWRFLTEWLTLKDQGSLDIEMAECVCNEKHRYYPAAWLEPLRENTWVRTSNDARTYATPPSLANLLRGDGSDPGILRHNIAATKLLEALGISYFDLLRAYGATTEEQRREQDEVLTGILATSRGNVGHLDHARQYLEDLRDDEGLPSFIAERRERRRRIHESQSLGDKVEELVKESLEGAGFTVQRTGVGSDFQIEFDDIASLQLSRASESWLVEVKGTRVQGARITEMQARTAVTEGNRFLLCVVPVEGEIAEIGLDDVRNSMRFVEDMGPRLAHICDNLETIDNMQNSAVRESDSAIQLQIEGGTVRVSVASSVWENDGFPLSQLASHLK